MHFYCQLDYRHVPYPSLTSPQGNLADNGCGVCCASMVVEALTEQDYPPEKCAVLAKQCGAREGFGTDMSIFAPAVAKAFSLNVLRTESTDEVLAFLQQKKGMVIANTIGNREDWIGVFSDSRHYIVLCSADQTKVQVLDPMLSEGRYDCEGRRGKVELNGYYAYADFSVIENDCKGKAYYLFTK